MKFSQNALEANPDEVEIELESPYPLESVDTPHRQTNNYICA